MLPAALTLPVAFNDTVEIPLATICAVLTLPAARLPTLLTVAAVICPLAEIAPFAVTLAVFVVPATDKLPRTATSSKFASLGVVAPIINPSMPAPVAPLMFPVAEMLAVVNNWVLTLPLVTVPVTDSSGNVPIAVATTPINWLPLPIKKLPTTLPVVDTAPFTVKSSLITTTELSSLRMVLVTKLDVCTKGAFTDVGTDKAPLVPNSNW